LFLDDLQWLDSATLDLIEDILTQSDARHLMLIGAYRDNEVNSTHPLMRKLDAIRRTGKPVQEIVLAPLGREDLAQLIKDALHCETERATALADGAKLLPTGLSSHLYGVKVAGHGEGKAYIYVNDAEGLVSLVQMGTIEFHAWNATVDDVKHPDRVIFDLDPAPDVVWEEVKRAALEVRANLKRFNLVSFLKTTGGKGLHVMVPFARGPRWAVCSQSILEQNSRNSESYDARHKDLALTTVATINANAIPSR
jgi:hypothetical protein